MLKIIASVSNDNIIGINGQLAQPLPADLAFFKEQTLGCKCFAAAKTHTQVRHLLGRNWILLSKKHYKSQFEAARNSDSVEWVIGGAKAYELAMPFAEELVISRPYAKVWPSPLASVVRFPEIPPEFFLRETVKRNGFDVEYWVRKP